MTDIWLVYMIYIQVSTYCDHFCFLVCKPRNMQCPNVCQRWSKRKSYQAMGGLIGKQEGVRGAMEKWCAFASEWEETGCSFTSYVNGILRTWTIFLYSSKTSFLFKWSKKLPHALKHGKYMHTDRHAHNTGIHPAAGLFWGKHVWAQIRGRLWADSGRSSLQCWLLPELLVKGLIKKANEFHSSFSQKLHCSPCASLGLS